MARIDLLIFGATGFTGKHCIPYVYKLAKAHGRSLTWGVSGRSEEGLEKVLKEMGDKIGQDLSKIPLVLADIKKPETLKAMAEQTRIVINCCGPYRFLGPEVVKACIAAGTHHVDVSGEPYYMESLQLEQNGPAKEKEVYVISSCGFDSIPTELGIVYLEKNFEGTLNSVLSYLENEFKDHIRGPFLNYGTWETGVYWISQMAELKQLRRQLFPKKLPKMEPKVTLKLLPHKVNGVDGWVLPFLGSDRSVARRSQQYFFENENKRPIQVETYFIVKSFMGLILFGIFGAMFAVLSNFNFGRSLLLNFPGFFSAGFFGKENPSQATIENTTSKLTLVGEGWNEKLSEPTDKFKIPPNKKLVVRVSGKNPGYGITCAALVLSAILVLTEQEKLPKGGGVYTPGVAFANTSMIIELQENGLSFEIVDHKE